jgi:hypothetical protein
MNNPGWKTLSTSSLPACTVIRHPFLWELLFNSIKENGYIFISAFKTTGKNG